jgi:DnaJ homolog subfamily C member 7
MDLEQYQNAVDDYRCGFNLSNSLAIKKMLKEAKLALKNFKKKKDHYEILGVHQDACEREITKAYRKKALQHHPDKHSNATEEERKQQGIIFKEVHASYDILLDPKQRALHDDRLDLDNTFTLTTEKAFNLFNAFYGGDVEQQFHDQEEVFPFSFHFDS